MPKIYDPSQEVIERAKEWYYAKKQAEENAGQPINWESYTLDRLERAVKDLIDNPSIDPKLAYGRHVV